MKCEIRDADVDGRNRCPDENAQKKMETKNKKKKWFIFVYSESIQQSDYTMTNAQSG